MWGSLSSINLIYCRFFLAHKFCYWSSLRQTSESSFLLFIQLVFFFIILINFPSIKAPFLITHELFPTLLMKNVHFNQLPNTTHSTVICLSLHFLLSCFLSSIECTFACRWWWCWCLSLTLICYTKWFFFFFTTMLML